MATKKDLNRFAAIIAQEHSDLVVIGHYLVLKPVNAMVRCVGLSNPTTTLEFQHYTFVQPLMFENTRFWASFRLQRPAEQRLWNMQDPDSVAEFKAELARDVLPMLRSIVTLDDFVARLGPVSRHAERYFALAFEWFCVDLARGDFEAADAFIADIRAHPEKWRGRLGFEDLYLSIFLPLAPLVAARDRPAIAAILRRFEGYSVRHLGLEKVWQHEPFSLELQG